MKLPLNWVRDYADFTTTPHEYAEKMTMSGSKVEGYSCEADGISNVVIAKILKLENHPDSDHLWICTVDVGAAAPIIIVTGAQNLKVGDLCPCRTGWQYPARRGENSPRQAARGRIERHAVQPWRTGADGARLPQRNRRRHYGAGRRGAGGHRRGKGTGP